MRFNHMELTFPTGALDQATRDEIAEFYGDVFGWACLGWMLGVAVVRGFRAKRGLHTGGGIG